MVALRPAMMVPWLVLPFSRVYKVSGYRVPYRRDHWNVTDKRYRGGYIAHAALARGELYRGWERLAAMLQNYWVILQAAAALLYGRLSALFTW